MVKTKEKTLPTSEKGVLQKLPLALTGGFCLFLTLDAGLLIMLALAHFLENATAGALPLKPFERTFQGLIFADTYLGHCYPSPRSRTMADRGASLTLKNHIVIIQPKRQ